MTEEEEGEKEKEQEEWKGIKMVKRFEKWNENNNIYLRSNRKGEMGRRGVKIRWSNT